MKIFKELSRKNPRVPGETTTTTTTTQEIPLTSLEAYQRLYAEDDDFNLAYLLFHFNRLFDVQNSQLTDLTSTVRINNQEFIDDLNATAQRVITAIDDEKPYPSLYGDTLKLQNKFQIILRYYKEQCDQDQPVANAFLASFKANKTMVNAALANPGTLSPEDSELLMKHTINSAAEFIMCDHIPEIETFVECPFLIDHSGEPDFSYSRPR